MKTFQQSTARMAPMAGACNHNPEIAPGGGIRYNRTEAACGVHRAVVHGNTHNVDKAERARPMADLRIYRNPCWHRWHRGSTRTKKNVSSPSLKEQRGCRSGLQDVCGQIAADAAVVPPKLNPGAMFHHGVEAGRRLRWRQAAGTLCSCAFTAAHATGQEHGERYGGVCTWRRKCCQGNSTGHTITRPKHNPMPRPSDRRTDEHCATAGEKNQKHCSDTFSK